MGDGKLRLETRKRDRTLVNGKTDRNEDLLWKPQYVPHSKQVVNRHLGNF